MNFVARIEQSMRVMAGKKPFPVVNGHVIKPGANLHGSYLWKNDKLVGADLRRANLSNSLIDEANLTRAKLNKADISNASLKKSILVGADLSGADLTNTRARSANFSGADLSGADLQLTDLRGSDFHYAKLGDIRDAFVSGAKVVNGRGREIELRNFSDLPSQKAKQAGHFDQWIKRDRTGEGPAAITRPAVKP